MSCFFMYINVVKVQKVQSKFLINRNDSPDNERKRTKLSKRDQVGSWISPKGPKMIPKSSHRWDGLDGFKEERKELKGRNDTMIHPRIEAERTENE